MPIRIEWKNGSPVAECDTVAEAVEMMRAASTSQSGASPAPAPIVHKPEQQKLLLSEDIVSFIRQQKPQVVEVLRTLFSLGAPTKADDLASMTDLTPAAFGGIFGAISKTASRAGIPLDGIYTGEVRFDGPRRERWYAPGRLLMEHGDKVFQR